MDDVELGPAYLWREALDLGARRRQVVAAGERISRGLYLSYAEDSNLLTRCRAWTRLLPPDTAFGLETAVQLFGVGMREAPAHVRVVLRPRPVLPQRRGLAVHVRQIRDDDVVEVNGLRLTSGAQTFLDLSPRQPPAELVAIGDALMRAGHLDHGALARRLLRADRVRGVVRARELAPMLSPRAASRPESLLRYWLSTSELPEPETQVPVLDRWGREVVHADLGYRAWKVALEYEGRQHADAGEFGRDVDPTRSWQPTAGWSSASRRGTSPGPRWSSNGPVERCGRVAGADHAGARRDQ